MESGHPQYSVINLILQETTPASSAVLSHWQYITTAGPGCQLSIADVCQCNICVAFFTVFGHQWWPVRGCIWWRSRQYFFVMTGLWSVFRTSQTLTMSVTCSSWHSCLHCMLCYFHLPLQDPWTNSCFSFCLSRNKLCESTVFQDQVNHCQGREILPAI